MIRHKCYFHKRLQMTPWHWPPAMSRIPVSVRRAPALLKEAGVRAVSGPLRCSLSLCIRGVIESQGFQHGRLRGI